MPKISLIIPMYNVQNLLSRTLQSCTNQTFKDIEIIIIDDKSEDESLNIALEFAKKDQRIKIFKNDKNLGTFASRNLGVLRSSADFVMFLDADDFLPLRACEIAICSMKPELDLLCFDAFVHRVKTKQFYRFKKDEIFTQEQFLEFLIKQRHFCWSVWAKVFKKDLILKIFEKIDIFEKLCYGEDVLFCYIYFMFCKKIAIFKECLYYYEFNENGRYENKNKEILWQNYQDKKRSLEILKSIKNDFWEFNKKFFLILEKEIKSLEGRL
ncbi:glycosyltransferase family 2 protein [Campylobacter molothri]|uniref:glycosyltransferase family 2 protein n=1 Tax=Campylobacter molothri TaxID=1032242 RepID=UPI001EFAD287|nr:glycosyltransferase family 2 protein [Campylobacter sp. RM10537]MBZ7949052.1 glycosyltransferase family 2 protein [Campylobacter sp. RM10534]ULO00012.1 glycosyltransferase, family 2 [Campylobacter sp. RM10537]